MRKLTIGSHTLHDASPALIVAEIGNNHGGSVELAREMIEVAARSGAHAVKFQRRTLPNLYTDELWCRPYTGRHSRGSTYGEHRAALELPDSAWDSLRRVADACGVLFFATPFDEQAADFLAEMNLPCTKIASACVKHHPLIRRAVDRTRGPVILSTGGHFWHEIDAAAALVPTERLCLLHAVASYPTPDDQVYLGAIASLRERYPDVVVGYSNHNAHGPVMPTAAYALGARVIELHFTLDRSASGTDHAMSIEPGGLVKTASYLRRLSVALHGRKPHPSERAAILKMSHSVVAARDLPAGHVLTAQDLAIKSPGGGVSPDRIAECVGVTLTKELHCDDWIPDPTTHRAVPAESQGTAVGH